jgi:hypothetical protein|nr:MAG TPA: hypothetical protein [Caudoviricetes sp.]
MNAELILKSTGKEFVIINELIKFIKYSDCIFINKANPLVYKSGDNSITMSTENENEVVIDEKIRDIIKIIDISEPKNKIELDVSVGVIRLYETYEFKVSLASDNVYTIKGKFKTRETAPISSIRMAEFGFGRIRKIYEKIESINLIDSDLFKNDKIVLKNYKITMDSGIDNIDNIDLDGIKLIVKKFYNVIDDFYKEGITKVSPKDSGK